MSEYERTTGGNRFKATAYKKAAFALNEQKERIKNGYEALKIVVFTEFFFSINA